MLDVNGGKGRFNAKNKNTVVVSYPPLSVDPDLAACLCPSKATHPYARLRDCIARALTSAIYYCRIHRPMRSRVQSFYDLEVRGRAKATGVGLEPYRLP